jgi:hypothetical protein
LRSASRGEAYGLIDLEKLVTALRYCIFLVALPNRPGAPSASETQAVQDCARIDAGVLEASPVISAGPISIPKHIRRS